MEEFKRLSTIERECDNNFWIHKYANPKYRESVAWNKESVPRNNGIQFTKEAWDLPPIRKRLGSKGLFVIFILHNSDDT